MSLIMNGEFLGLPAPIDSEFEMFQNYLRASDEDRVEQGTLPLEDLAELVISKRPFIRQVIQDTLLEYRDPNSDKPLAPEIIEICDGIESGFEFMVGCITYIRFLRSGELSLEEYINTISKDTNDLPLRKISQLARTQKVQSGQALTDVIHTDLIDDSSELAGVDTGDYFWDASRIKLIVDIEVAKLLAERDELDEDESKYVRGFYIGLENTIEMYIQSSEQHYINKLKA